MSPDKHSKDNIRRSVHLGIKTPNELGNTSMGLALSLSYRNLKAAAYSIEEKRILGLWKFDFSHPLDEHDYAKLIKGVAKLDKGLDSEGYEQFKFQLFTTKSFLLPKELYSKDIEEKYYGVNFFNYPEDHIFKDKPEGCDFINVYSLPKGLESRINKTYPGTDIQHQSSQMLKSLLKQYKDHDGNLGFVHQNGGHVSIFFVRNGELRFCNTFVIRSSEELLYFLLGAGEETNFDSKEDRLILLGDFETGSESYVLLNKYFRDMSLVLRPVSVRYDEQFSKFRMHPYYALFSSIE